MNKGSDQRLFLVDVWLCIALIFVIIGHCSVSYAPPWYHILKKRIYSFHMESFFFISGFLMHYKCKPMENFHGYLSIISKKFMKFAIPFLIFGTLLSLVPLTQHHFSYKSLRTALNFFYRPTASYVIFLWFLYVLLEYYLIAPLISRFYNSAIIIFLLAGIWLSIKTVHCDRFALYLFSRHFLYLVLGIIAAENLNILRCLPHFPVYLAACVFLCFSWIIPKYRYPASGTFGLSFMLALSWIFAPLLRPYRAIVEHISRNCFSIYLYQMIAIQLLAKFFAFLPDPSKLFPLFLILVIPTAIIFPLTINKALNQLSTHFFHRAIH